MSNNTITPAEALVIADLVNYTEQGISSRVLAKNGGAPFDAIVMIAEGSLILTIAGKPVTAKPGDIVRMPANIPHAVDAPERAKMLLVMLREPENKQD